MYSKVVGLRRVRELEKRMVYELNSKETREIQTAGDRLKAYLKIWMTIGKARTIIHLCCARSNNTCIAVV